VVGISEKHSLGSSHHIPHMRSLEVIQPDDDPVQSGPRSNFTLSAFVVCSRTSSSMLRAIHIVPVRRWCQSVEVVRVQGLRRPVRPDTVRIHTISITLRLVLFPTTWKIWNSHHRRLCQCIGWSWEATPVRVCHHRSKEIPVDQMYVSFVQNAFEVNRALWQV